MYGTGLGSFNQPTRGLGLETLGMHLAAMQMTRDNGGDTVMWHLGTEGYNVSPQVRDYIIKQMEEIASNMASNLSGMPVLMPDGNLGNPIGLEFFPAFCHGESQGYQDLVAETQQRFNVFAGDENIDYVFGYPLLQTAQEVDLIQNYGVCGQVGWDNSKKTTEAMTFDDLVLALQNKRLSEKFFIDLLKNRYPELALDAFYVPAAIDFATGNQQAPYTVTSDSRPLITERFSVFCANNRGLKGYDKAIGRMQTNIVERYENLFGVMGDGCTIEKIDEIQNKILL